MLLMLLLLLVLLQLQQLLLSLMRGTSGWLFAACIKLIELVSLSYLSVCCCHDMTAILQTRAGGTGLQMD